MLKRRVFCYLCAALGVAGGAVTAAQAQSAGIKRTIASTTDGPSPGYHTVLAEVEIAPNAAVVRHTHPGIESTYVLEGGGIFSMRGQDARHVKATDAVQIPPEVAHSFQNGPQTTRLIVNYVVEKDKPLATPAPE